MCHCVAGRTGAEAGDLVGLHVELDLVARLKHVAQPLPRLARVQLAGGDAVAEEDARVRLRHHRQAPCKPPRPLTVHSTQRMVRSACAAGHC